MRTIPSPLPAHGRAVPTRPLLWEPGRPTPWTARELAARAGAAAGALARDLGVCARDRVHLAADLDPAWLIALEALLWLDAVPVLTAPGAALPAGVDAVARLDTAAARALSDADAPAPPAPDWPLDAERAVVFSSGSTGEPAPVALGTEALLVAATASAFRLGLHLDDAWLLTLPPWHVGGLSVILRALLYGTAVAWAAPFDAARASAAIDAWPVTQLSLVPTTLDRLVAARGGRPFPSRLRWALVGGGAASEASLAAAEALGLTVLPTWGMSESGAQLATRPPTEPRRPGATGPALPLVAVAASGGVLEARGLQVGGALASRDVGDLDGDGWVRIAGRLDRQFKSGGELVAPELTEAALGAHPAVREAVCVDLPSEVWGRALAAWVEPVPTEPDLDADALAAWLAGRLPPHQRPRVLRVAPLPPPAGPKRTAAERQALAAILQE